MLRVAGVVLYLLTIPTAGWTAPLHSAPIPPILDLTAIKDGRDGRPRVDACDDFYEYACGAWIDRTVIPGDKERVGRQTTAATDASQETLNQILAAYSRGDFSVPSRFAEKFSRFYNSCLDADVNEAKGYETLKQKIDLIKGTSGRQNLARLVAQLSGSGVSILFDAGSMQDPNDAKQVVLTVRQGGLGFSSKTYYLDQDAKAKETRAKYVEYLASLFRLIGNDAAKAEVAANAVLAVETKLAQNEYSLEDLSDATLTNHPMNRAALLRLMPEFDFDEYLKVSGLDSLDSFSIATPEYLAAAGKVIASSTPEEITAYMTARVLDSGASFLSAPFRDARFEFWGKYLMGQKTPPPRWKSCVASTAKLMGYPLAEAYVSTFNGDAIKSKTNEMIGEIRKSFVENLADLNHGALAWIDDDTMKAAVAKSALITQKIGAPSIYRDYSAVSLSADNYLANAFALSEFETARDLGKVGLPVDKTEWEMMPWEVNAYYSRSNNEFVFPFGILQPPSMDLAASDGANYGSFGGGTIGHELLHGFDKNGAKYDGEGTLRNWWTPTTGEQFTKRAQCFIDQANRYEIKQLGLKVNGAQTIDENLADQGGVKLGYHALDRILKARPEAPPLGGYSERQQYWLAYAQSWCMKSTPEQLRRQALIDVHPVSEFRINGVVMNRPEFARDFNCKVGSRMAPVDRCSIW